MRTSEGFLSQKEKGDFIQQSLFKLISILTENQDNYQCYYILAFLSRGGYELYFKYCIDVVILLGNPARDTPYGVL